MSGQPKRVSGGRRSALGAWGRRAGATTRRPPSRGGGGDRGAPSGAPLRRAHPIGAVSRGGLVRLCSRGRSQAWTWAARGTRSQLIVGAPTAGALEHVAVAAARTDPVQRGGDDAGADHKGPSLGRGRPVAPTTRCTRGVQSTVRATATTRGRSCASGTAARAEGALLIPDQFVRGVVAWADSGGAGDHPRVVVCRPASRPHQSDALVRERPAAKLTATPRQG